jgi:putative ABC transport system substrate-binding protein
LDNTRTSTSTPFRIGLIHYVPKGDPFVSTEDIADFKSAMQRLGYEDGRHVVYNERYGERDKALTQQQAEDMLASEPDLICSFLTNPNIALKNTMQATGQNVPVLCWATDLKEAGLIETHRRPGGNFTGFTYEPYHQWTKVRLLKLAVPDLVRVAHLYNPTYLPAPAVLHELQQAATSMGLELKIYEALQLDQLQPAIDAMRTDGCRGAIAGPHDFFNRNGEMLGKAFLAAGIAAVGNQMSITRTGGLASFNPPKKRGWPLMAQVADRILKGTPPAEIPIERSLRGVLTLNLQSARAGPENPRKPDRRSRCPMCPTEASRPP